MRKLAMIALATSLSSWLSGPSEALEFTADRLTRTQQGLHHTRIFYRDHMWRLEHNEAGPVQRHHCQARPRSSMASPPLDASCQNCGVQRRLCSSFKHAPRPGDIAGSDWNAILDGHPTTLYEVGVTLQDGRTETYYQWIANDIDFSLKHTSKNGDWMVENCHVRMGPIADSFFQLPHRYFPMDAK